MRQETGRGDYGPPFGGTGQQERPAPSEAERKRAAVELIKNHDAALRASARRYSLCAADAEDAYQRGIEILLGKAPVADPRQLLPWARTVIKHESLALRRARERVLPRAAEGDVHGPEREADDWVDRLEAPGPRPEETVLDRERVARSREALAELKPDERKALTQLAEGYSYAEIGSLNGWTYTKVNRCLAEGRDRLRSVVRQSETGERCLLIEPLISACSDGELPADRVAEVENHLAACGRCRALLREYRAIPGEVAAFSPVLGLLASTGQAGIDWVREVWFGVSTRVYGLLAGNDRGLIAAFVGGGARGPGPVALAKLTAVCVGTAGGAAACVATGVVPGLPVDRDPVDRPVRERPAVSGTPAAGPGPEAVAPPVRSGRTGPRRTARDGGDSGNEPGPGSPPANAPSLPAGTDVAREFGAGGAPTPAPSSPVAVSAGPDPSSPTSPKPSVSRPPVSGTGEFGP